MPSTITQLLPTGLQNHRGAMMELGEGLCKLRKLSLADGDGDGGGDPFSRFRDDVAAVLQFLYRTQKELAACTYARANFTDYYLTRQISVS
jgi:hypothetical protein